MRLSLNPDSLADDDDDSVADDFDGDDESVIHVIRRRPEVADQVIEFDPIGGQVHKGRLRLEQQQQQPHHEESMGSKIARIFHGVPYA